MTPKDLEDMITSRSCDVLRFQNNADNASCAVEKGAWRDEARRAAADVSKLSAMRSPETVKAMEEARGLL